MIATFLLIAQLATPAGAGSGEPFLFATKRDVILSWIEGTSLRFARYDGARWSEPRTILRRDDLIVNWADFPSVVEDANGVLFAPWSQQNGDIRVTITRDGGKTWSESFALNHDDRHGERGFTSLVPLPGGGVAATWLSDGTLRYTTIDASGKLAPEQQLDDRTCECCTTGMALTSSGPLIVYRDRSADEIRDIAYIRPGSQPRTLHADQWKINGCPVNGPQIDAIGNRFAVAWFTQAGVYAQFDGGQPIRIDDGHPQGRVDIVMLDGDSAVVSWIEQNALRARKITRRGAEPARTVASSTDRGFPRMARRGREVFFAWTEGKQARVARVRF